MSVSVLFRFRGFPGVLRGQCDANNPTEGHISSPITSHHRNQRMEFATVMDNIHNRPCMHNRHNMPLLVV
ncbi:hypothetical protein GE061_011293 [Apolygus lucorum]|uniref:Uncharacterized protein n=1 Tax=Apolygus lucorum TaxID=248454 RepID=A0A8S9XWX3_APOLU|nr:hypothetical protein GE061_011293 [Apolygus lucorum]